MALTDVELDLIFFIERFAASTGSAPTDSQINQRFTGVDLKAFKANELVQRSFKARGIVYPAMQDKLTDEQMHAIAAMLDPYDRRSDEKKLRDIGITTRQWATWLLDDEFASYVTERSEALLRNTTFEAHKGVIKGARNGNVAAVKLHYEVTGRHRPDQEQQIDIQRVLHAFIEVIQRYVKDPVTMHAIAMDLSQLGSAETLANGLTNQMMGNAQFVRQKAISGSVVNENQIPVPGGFDDET